MKKDLDAVLKNLKGEPIKDGEDNLTIKSVIVNCLIGGSPTEQPPPDGNEKAKRWSLAMMLYGGSGEQELTPEEIVMIKKLVGSMYTPLIVGPIFELLK